MEEDCGDTNDATDKSGSASSADAGTSPERVPAAPIARPARGLSVNLDDLLLDLDDPETAALLEIINIC